jgi:hypothetical protein
MADASFPSYKFPSMGKKFDRRKVRKGTQSCWECKRRGTLCVSQEFPNVGLSTSSTRQVGDRLGRVEALVEQLVKSADTSGILDGPMDLPPRQSRDLQGQLASSTSNSPYPNGRVPTGGVSTPGPSDFEVPVSLGELSHETVVRIASSTLLPCTSNTRKQDLDPENLAVTKPSLKPPKPPKPPTVIARRRTRSQTVSTRNYAAHFLRHGPASATSISS